MAADGAYCLPLLYHVTSPPLRLSGLLSVTLVILGSLALAVLIPLTLVFRERDRGDTDLREVAWFLVPLLLSILYSALWWMVVRVFLHLRRVQVRLVSLQP